VKKKRVGSGCGFISWAVQTSGLVRGLAEVKVQPSSARKQEAAMAGDGIARQ
jgi:hypothetical protein